MLYCLRMSKIKTRSKKIALLVVAAIALGACGGSSENSSSAVVRTKNAALNVATCAAGGPCVVGDTGPGGGKVFYVAPTSFTSAAPCGVSCKYLEAAPAGWITSPAGQANCPTAGTATADPSCEWSGNTTTMIGVAAQGTAIGTGFANTSAITTQNTTQGKAATVARAYQGGRKTDWYLPSKDELNQVYLKKGEIGGIDSDYYWSSSEVDADNAWYQDFGDGSYLNYHKVSSFYVRPVRAGTFVIAASTNLPPATCAEGGPCVVGDTGPGGGKVFYVAPTSFTSAAPCGDTCNYLEAASAGWITSPAGQANCTTAGTSTIDPQCEWSANIASAIGASARGTAIGTGFANTSSIIARNNTAGKAATASRAFQGGGKTDWYLPSSNELAQMVNQKGVIGGIPPISGTQTASYWNSTENSSTFGQVIDLLSGNSYLGNKRTKFYVRPVRAGTFVLVTTTTTTEATTTTVAATTTTVAATTTTATPMTTTTIGTTCATGAACAVGDTGPGGGKVFYVAPTNFTSGAPCGTTCRYLEAAPAGWITSPSGQTNCSTRGTSTVDPKCQWSGDTRSGLADGATGEGVGAGYGNTTVIIAQSDVGGKAATVARAYRGGNKTDWYLPSKLELTQLCRYSWNLTVSSWETTCTGMTGTVRDGLSGGEYWSSSQADSRNAYRQFFDTRSANNTNQTNKEYALSVRPVRAGTFVGSAATSGSTTSGGTSSGATSGGTSSSASASSDSNRSLAQNPGTGVLTVNMPRETSTIRRSNTTVGVRIQTTGNPVLVPSDFCTLVSINCSSLNFAQVEVTGTNSFVATAVIPNGSVRLPSGDGFAFEITRTVVKVAVSGAQADFSVIADTRLSLKGSIVPLVMTGTFVPSEATISIELTNPAVGLNDAMGIPGFTISSITGKTTLIGGVPRGVGFSVSGTVPTFLREMGINPSTQFTAAFEVGAGITLGMSFGSKAAGSPDIFKIKNVLSARYLAFSYSSLGSTIAGVSYPKGFAVSFDGKFGETSVVVDGNVSFAPLQYNITFTIGAYSFGGFAFEESTGEFVRDTTGLKVGFSGGLAGYGISARLKGSFDAFGGVELTAQGSFAPGGINLGNLNFRMAVTRTNVEFLATGTQSYGVITGSVTVGFKAFPGGKFGFALGLGSGLQIPGVPSFGSIEGSLSITNCPNMTCSAPTAAPTATLTGSSSFYNRPRQSFSVVVNPNGWSFSKDLSFSYDKNMSYSSNGFSVGARAWGNGSVNISNTGIRFGTGSISASAGFTIPGIPAITVPPTRTQLEKTVCDPWYNVLNCRQEKYWSYAGGQETSPATAAVNVTLRASVGLDSRGFYVDVSGGSGADGSRLYFTS
jgi:hypothetical protein